MSHDNNVSSYSLTVSFVCYIDWAYPVDFSSFSLTDPCEYENIAHSNLGVVRKLVIRLMDYQKKAQPPWYPQRDSLANPALLGGSWGPWISIDGLTSQSKSQHRTTSYTQHEIKPNATLNVWMDSTPFTIS